MRPKGYVPPCPGPSRGFLHPKSPVPPPAPVSTPPKYQSCSINSRVPCQVHSLTSRITHAKPQVFYETFPVMKTFLWGFIFFFPSSSPPLLLLFPVGWWPAQGAAVMLSLRAGRSAVPELGCSRDEGIGGSRPLGWSPFSGDCTGAVQGPNCYVNPGSCHDRAQALVPASWCRTWSICPDTTGRDRGCKPQ